MDTTSNNILYNIVTVTRLDKTDEFDGFVTFKNSGQKEFAAFFWSPTVDLNETYEVKFGFLEQPLEWGIIFTENRSKVKSLVSTSTIGSYYAYGKILSINPIIADFGDLIMEIGEWTHDERVIGEYIYYKIDRLDVVDVMRCT